MMLRISVWLALAALLGAPNGVSAQSPQSAQSLAAACAAGGGELTVCARTAGAGRDLAGYVAILTGPGADVPGQASTLGRRLGGAPRIAASLRVGGANVSVPTLRLVGAADASPFVRSTHATVALGLFDGFQALPTVGGLLSFDVVASGALLHFSDNGGFQGGTKAYSIGARLGVLRESFTLPAVTVSASRRWVGDLQLGNVAGNYQGEVALDPSITSVRATVGKDLFAFGVLAGLGWDSFSSPTTLRASDGGAGFTTQSATLEEERWSVFGGVSKQVGVIAWLSLEGGWVNGFDPINVGGGSSPDVARTIYGSLAFLLKL